VRAAQVSRNRAGSDVVDVTDLHDDLAERDASVGAPLDDHEQRGTVASTVVEVDR